jgi:hypothetical protein
MRFRLILLALLALFSLPAFAQEDSQHTVAFDGFSFSYDTSIAADVNITYHSAEELTDIFPTMAPHTQFMLYSGDTVPAFPAEAPGLIRVFSTAEFDEGQSGVLAQLQMLLDERPDLAGYMESDTPLPFLPIFPAGQVIRARAQYVETGAVTGISYITAYQQAMEPFTSSSFIYSFQGLSADGAHYVSAIFRLNTGLFSDELPSDFDYASFSEQIDQYLADSITTLNEAGADDISPSLDALDALIASFTFDGAAS